MSFPYSLRPAAWRGYRQTLLVTAGSNLGDPNVYLLWCAMGFLRVVILLSIWRMVLQPDEVVSGMSVASVLTYTLIAAIFSQQLDVRTELTETIWSGVVATRYLQPIGVPGLYLAEISGYWLFSLGTFGLPLLLAAPLLGVDPRPASALLGLLFIPSLALAISVGLALDFLLGALLVVTRENIWTIQALRAGIGLLLSGALLPLQFYPWGLGDLFAWLPFAAMGSSPLRIYTGTGDPLPLLGSQLAWALILWPLTAWIWRSNREAVAGTGG